MVERGTIENNKAAKIDLKKYRWIIYREILFFSSGCRGAG